MDEVIIRVVANKPEYVPVYKTSGSVGADLRAAVDSTLILEPGEIAVVPTGIRIELPEGYEAQVRPRSGLAMQYGLTLVNAPGTIDWDYRGEIKVIMVNLGKKSVRIEPGMRVAQLVISPVVRGRFVVVESLSDTERGEGGFGHTGTD